MNKQKTCTICGKPFIAKRCDQVTCSPECQKVRNAVRVSAYQKERYKRKDMDSRICVCCGREYGYSEWDSVDENVEIIAWIPLPKPYKGE